MGLKCSNFDGSGPANVGLRWFRGLGISRAPWVGMPRLFGGVWGSRGPCINKKTKNQSKHISFFTEEKTETKKHNLEQPKTYD